ncbi:MAG: hypothetical protein HY235_18775 [Acidobacteria bacterium]|nr:hypothetical protein [Acidobacteriota bacterium]
MKLNLRAVALAAGSVWGLTVVVATLVSLWRGSGHHLNLLSAVYPGYHVSYLGSAVGLVYGVASGLAAGALFAWLHNQLLKEA